MKHPRLMKPTVFPKNNTLCRGSSGQSHLQKGSLLLVLLIFFSLVQPATLFATAATSASLPAVVISQDDQEMIRELITQYYVGEIPPEQLEKITVESLTQLLDPNSYYLTSEEMTQFIEAYNGEFEGIGAYMIEQQGHATIAEPMPNSPAEKAGLLPGDQIMKVDGSSVEGQSLGQVIDQIKGPAGTEVMLHIRRPGTKELLEMTLTRQRIIVSSVTTDILDHHIGYLKVSHFSDHTTEYAQTAVNDFRAKGVDRLVIDLRGNPGGLLIEAVEFSRLFIPRGPVVHVVYREGMITYSSFLGERPFEKMVLLVNESSASAAEIFAAAFKDSGAGIIVGENTYGKGSVQRMYPLPSGAGFKQTEAIYVSPDYNIIDDVGVSPSISIMRFHPDHDPEKLLPMEITRKPELGIRGNDVAAAQQRLHLMGYSITDERGIFGPSTQEAVRAFQRDQQLFSYGVLDYSTQRRLQREYLVWLLAPEQDLQLYTALYYLKGNQSSHDGVQPVPHGSPVNQ